jgi:hypothetical protein
MGVICFSEMFDEFLHEGLALQVNGQYYMQNEGLALQVNGQYYMQMKV